MSIRKKSQLCDYVEIKNTNINIYVSMLMLFIIFLINLLFNNCYYYMLINHEN